MQSNTEQLIKLRSRIKAEQKKKVFRFIHDPQPQSNLSSH